MFEGRKNFVFSTVEAAPSPTTSGTSLDFASADIGLFGDPAEIGDYKLVIFPTGEQPTEVNAEVVTVTAISSNTLTIVRSAENSTARDIQVGDIIAHVPTAESIATLSHANWFPVTQTAHGFDELDAIYHDGTEWVLAQADDEATLGTHIVGAVFGANNFACVSQGRIQIASHGLTPGSYYYVSDSVAGGLTATAPDTYHNPIVFAEDADYLHVYSWQPSESVANTDWTEIDQAVLTVSSDTLCDFQSIPYYKMYKLVLYTIATGGNKVERMRFNGDTGNNYARRGEANGGADFSNVSQSNLNIAYGATALPLMAEVLIVNITTQEKLLTVTHVEAGTAGAANAPNKGWIIGKWANTANPIDEINIYNDSTGDFASGSFAILFGKN